VLCFSIQERIAMSSLQGLPPLPRSLSGFNLSGRGESGEPPPPPTRSSSKSQRGGKPSSSRPSPPARQLTTLDTQLAVLRREMVLYSRIVCARFFSIAPSTPRNAVSLRLLGKCNPLDAIIYFFAKYLTVVVRTYVEYRLPNIFS